MTDLTTSPVAEHLFKEDGARDLDFAAFDAHVRRAVAYTLRNAAGSSLPDSWRTLTGEQLADAIAVHLCAGIHPVMSHHVVELAVEGAREALAMPGGKADNLRRENEVLRDQLASVRLAAESFKQAAALGAQAEPDSEAWASIAYEATRLVCAL